MTEYTDDLDRGRLNEHVDVDRLVADLGLDDDEIAWRKEFLNFDDADARTLEAFADRFADAAETFVEDFYDQLTDYEQTRAVIDRSPKDVEALKRTQIAYLMTLVDGEYDREYVRQRARIGKLHELLDMPMKQYIGQYDAYYELFLDVVGDRIADRLAAIVAEALADADGGDAPDADQLTRHLSDAVDECLADLHSLLKLTNFDMQVAVDTYLQSRVDEVERERDRFAALFENVPSPVVVVRVTDEGMRVEQVNTAFEELFGYTAADLADRDFEQYLTPAGEHPRPIEDRSVVANIETGSQRELSEAEVTLETQFSRRQFIRVSAPVDRPGLDDLEYGFYIDITDQKQRQERLQVLSRVLRHDIRNKLSVVKGCASTLADHPDAADRETLLDYIDGSADKLLETSEQIRRIEQTIAGEADRRPINLTTIVESAVADVRDRFPDCQFLVSSTGEAWVHAPGALTLAVEEVIENAAQHNDASDPHVDVSVSKSLNEEYVAVRVTDNGPGIPPAEYEILTGDRERSQIDHPSGLGLWAVNWIVTGAGGALQFAANAPRGSIVTLRFRRCDAPDR